MAPSAGPAETARGGRGSVLLTVSGVSGVTGVAQVINISPLSLLTSLSPLDDCLSVTCGEGNQFRTRDVAQPAVNGGSSCLGKKYSIGGKVRPDLT